MKNELVEKFKKLIISTFGDVKDPDQIAELCRKKEIEGFVSNSTSCPMVKLIKDQFCDYNVAFSVDRISYWWVFDAQNSIYFKSPEVCEEFSKRFDEGKYPDLIAWSNDESSTIKETEIPL